MDNAKPVIRVTLLALIITLLSTAPIYAESQWKIGDTVQLTFSTTNMGNVDVISSTGTITITGPYGDEYDAGDYDTNQVVSPGEKVEIPVTWDSTGMVPGVYGVILDGELVFINGESYTTHDVVGEAFQLYEPLTGLFTVPDIVNDASFTGVTLISDTYTTGGIFMSIVWINNTGTTSFIPEIYTSFTANQSTYGPYSTFYIDDPCIPGLHPYTYMCQLPIIMAPGEYECSTGVNMHYEEIDDDVKTSLDFGDFWTDQYKILEYPSNYMYVGTIHGIPDPSHSLLIGDDIAIQNTAPPTGFYNIGTFAAHSDTAYNMPETMGDRLALPFYLQKENSEAYMEMENPGYTDLRPTYNEWQLEALEKLPDQRPWTGEPLNTFSNVEEQTYQIPIGWIFNWKPIEPPVSAGSTINLPIFVRGPQVKFDATAKVNNNQTKWNPLSITVTINNNGDLIIQPDVEIKIQDSEGKVVETETVNEDEGKKVTPLGTESYEFKVFTPELVGDTKYKVEINVDQGDTYTTELTGIPDNDYTARMLQKWSEEGLKDFAASNNTGFDNLFKDVPFNVSGPFDCHLGLTIFSGDSSTDTSSTDTTTTDTTTETLTEPDTETETKQEKGLLESIINTIVNFFKGLFN